jgi:hypothetical protein
MYTKGKWTQGPWKVINRHGVLRVVADSGKPEVADVIGAYEPNAHLLAAAPDMYETLKFALPYIAKMVADNVNTVVPPQRALDYINQALAKAEGKEKE